MPRGRPKSRRRDSCAVDAGTVWHWSRRVEMRASMRNLLDQPSYSNAGPRWVYSSGRNGSITLDVVF